MKRIIVTLAFLFVAHVGLAQDASKADVLKVIQSSGAAGPMQMAKEQILQNIPLAKRAEFSKEFDATLPSFYDKIAVVYMETYTNDEIKAMLKFYESPVGKKISSNTAEIFKKSTEAGEEWSLELQGILMKYMQ